MLLINCISFLSLFSALFFLHRRRIIFSHSPLSFLLLVLAGYNFSQNILTHSKEEKNLSTQSQSICEGGLRESIGRCYLFFRSTQTAYQLQCAHKQKKISSAAHSCCWLDLRYRRWFIIPLMRVFLAISSLFNFHLCVIPSCNHNDN